MAEIRSSADIATKWSRVTPQRAEDYSRGVQSPRRSWSQQAGAANAIYTQAVTAAAQAGRYARGVQSAGDDKWRRKTLEKGVNRWPQGVATSAQEYQQGFEPFRARIEATPLPPRRPAGDPGNLERVRVIATALSSLKRGTASK